MMARVRPDSLILVKDLHTSPGHLVNEERAPERTKPETLSHIQSLIHNEYQDINRAKLHPAHRTEWQYFHRRDPRQTTFQFRGSDAGCFDSFATMYSDVETLSITENRRSATSIVSVSNHFADSFTKQHYDHLNAVRTNAGGVYLGQFRSNVSGTQWIADQIHRYVKEGKCSFGDIGILLRSVSTSVRFSLTSSDAGTSPSSLEEKLDYSDAMRFRPWVNSSHGYRRRVFFQKSPCNGRMFYGGMISVISR